MGDRSNIVIEDYAKRRVFLYGHWMGEGAIAHAVTGLRSGRVGDSSYLARIIFSAMIKGQESEETGFGISAAITDNQYPIIVIAGDDSTGLTWIEDEDHEPITAPVAGSRFIEAAEQGGGYAELIARLPAAGS